MEKIRLSLYKKKDALEEHRKRVSAVKAQVDLKAPIINTDRFIKADTLRDDFANLQILLSSKRELLEIINRFSRLSSKVRTFDTPMMIDPKHLWYESAMSNVEKIQRENKKFGIMLTNIKPKLDTRMKPKAAKEELVEARRRSSFALPQRLLQKYSNLDLFNLSGGQKVLRKLFRPQIYLDIQIKGCNLVERLTIQLYTEACPQAVLEFVRICKSKDESKISIVHIFPSLWMEGQLALEQDSFAQRKIEYDMRSLDHGSSGGILSFSNMFMDGFQQGLLVFSISFRPLPVLERQRVAFGRVTKGLSLLDHLKTFGSKRGKPLREVYVTGCGIIQ